LIISLHLYLIISTSADTVQIQKQETKLKLLVQDSVLLGQPVNAVVALPHPADGSTDGVGLEGASHTTGRLVNLGQVDLDGSVVLGRQDPVAGGALPWDVHVNIFSGFVLHGEVLSSSEKNKRSNSRPKNAESTKFT